MNSHPRSTRPCIALLVLGCMAACAQDDRICTAYLEIRLARAGILDEADAARVVVEKGLNAVEELLDQEIDLFGVQGTELALTDDGTWPEIETGDGFRISLIAFDSISGDVKAFGRSASFGCLASGELSVPLYIGPAHGFAGLESEIENRSGASTTGLDEGRVLVFGGRDALGHPVHPSALIYDHASGSLLEVENAPAARTGHSATRLADGSVLIIGGMEVGAGLATELLRFDPTRAVFDPVADISLARTGHAAVLLDHPGYGSSLEGKVLVIGGRDETASVLSSLVLVDLQTGSSTHFADLSAPRGDASATLLRSGELLVAGGNDADSTPLAIADLIDLDEGKSLAVNFCEGSDQPLCAARAGHAAVLLDDDNVLLWGGSMLQGELGPTAEVFCVSTMRSTPAGPEDVEPVRREGHTATRVGCRTPPCPILIAGGLDAGGSSMAPALFYPGLEPGQEGGSIQTFIRHSAEFERSGHAAASLPDGTVLLVGGAGPAIAPAAIYSSCEYDDGPMTCPQP
ncbi:MAG: hypothetical protein JXR96_23610 [Deltaproteobacteria bacterium]|nr:hypothetical protein [Deltaproteobacteria bacterium]